jgi:hypothetical protein
MQLLDGSPRVALYRGRELVAGGPGKTLKLAIFIFIKFWLQIWFQKYYISLNDT